MPETGRKHSLHFAPAAKPQVGGEVEVEFGWQDLSHRRISARLAILIVSIQTSPPQYLMLASLFSLIIQPTVISSWSSRAAAVSVCFLALWHNMALARHRDQQMASGNIWSKRKASRKSANDLAQYRNNAVSIFWGLDFDADQFALWGDETGTLGCVNFFCH